MANQGSPAPSQNWEPAQILAAAGPTVATILGFWAFHFFALRRQERQEVSERCTRIYALIHEATDGADAAWRVSGSDQTAREANLKAKRSIKKLGVELTSLKLACPSIDVEDVLVEFRRVCTEDIDDVGRAIDVTRCGDIFTKSTALHRALTMKFKNKFH